MVNHIYINKNNFPGADPSQFYCALPPSRIHQETSRNLLRLLESPGGGRYSFSLSADRQGISAGSPLAQFNGASYSASGFFFSDGTLDFTRLRVDPEPGGGGGGILVAELNPAGGGTGERSMRSQK